MSEKYNNDFFDDCVHCGKKVVYDPVDGPIPFYTDWRHVDAGRKCKKSDTKSHFDSYAEPKERE